MVTIKEKGLLLHIIKHCKRIVTKMQCVDLAMFSEDEDIQEIVCFNLLQIGELVKRFSDGFIKKHKDIPWNKIAGMRDIIAHGYGTIRLEEIYKTAILDIEPLIDDCKRILNEKSTI